MAVAKKNPVGMRRKATAPVRIDLKKERHRQGDRRAATRARPARVLRVDRETGRVLVEHVMMVKRHTRPNPAKQIKGGIAERESPIAVSNVMIVCPGCDRPCASATTWTRCRAARRRRTRVCRKCGQTLDRK